MIESLYWKQELHRIAGTLRTVARPKRWTERQHCVVERDVMVGFFMIRRLIELGKVSRVTKAFRLTAYAAPSRGRPVTQLNHCRLDSLYDFAREKQMTRSTSYIANQFIHAYTSFVLRDAQRNWESVLVVSDRERNRCMWRVPVTGIRSLFEVASEDYPARGALSMARVG